MSEEKLYAVKNDKGEYWDFLDNSGFWSSEIADFLTTPSKKQAELVADEMSGHVVALVEETEKVVLTKEQAKIVDEAHGFYLPATLISEKAAGEEELLLLMRAYINGYTVAKETKYYVKVLGGDRGYLNMYSFDDEAMIGDRKQIVGFKVLFTESELEDLKQRDDIALDWDKVKLIEVDDDEDK